MESSKRQELDSQLARMLMKVMEFDMFLLPSMKAVWMQCSGSLVVESTGM